MKTGVHHLGLATLDLDRTVDFWTKKLDCKVAWADVIEPPEGGKIEHVFMDTGDGTLIAFMCPKNVPGIPTEWATDINSAQNLPGTFLALGAGPISILKTFLESAGSLTITPGWS